MVYADVLTNRNGEKLYRLGGEAQRNGDYPQSLASVETILLTSGSGELRIGSEIYSVSEGNIFVIPGGREYDLILGARSKLLHISGSFNLLSYLDEVRMLEDNRFGEGKMLADLILINKEGNEGYLSLLCDAYARYILLNVDRSPRNTSAAISKIILKMEKEFSSSDLSIGRLLDESGYTKDYIRSEFEAVTGLTPKKYLNSVRMNKAKALIELADEMTIGEIAERCGVIDPTIFSRIFKKHFGVSPSQYRDSLKKTEGN